MNVGREYGPTRHACTIGLWGTYDVDNYGDVLFPRIAERELHRRLPDATLRFFSPFGVERPIRFDGGRPAEPLGRWSEARLEQLAADLDCVVIGGGEIIHSHYEHFTEVYSTDVEELRKRDPSRFFLEALGPDRERGCPVVWHAVGLPFDPTDQEAVRLRAALALRPYVAVRDELSKRRIQAAGVEREIAVVPDSAFLLRRLFQTTLLENRLRFLRLMGWYPADGHALVVQGNGHLLPHVPQLAAILSDLLARHPDHSLVSLQTGSCLGDGEFADALSHALPQIRHRIPAAIDVADVAAAIAASSGFIGVSLHGNITARVFGRPHVILNPAGYSKLDAFAQQLGCPECLVTDVSEVTRAFRAAVGQAVGQERVSDMESGPSIFISTASPRSQLTQPESGQRPKAQTRPRRSQTAGSRRWRSRRVCSAGPMTSVASD